jgi:anti-sigma regulatory factor (Ser/Thr protein kinase)
LSQDPPPPLTLPFTLEAPALARQYLRTYASHLPEPDLDDALLMTSELVSNAIEHGQPTIVLQVNFDPPHVTVDVFDDGSGDPLLDLTSVPTDDHGRGLKIVDAISTRWGITQHPDTGKSVWFQIRQ